jgi:hypothetical protein
MIQIESSGEVDLNSARAIFSGPSDQSRGQFRVGAYSGAALLAGVPGVIIGPAGVSVILLGQLAVDR